MGVLYPPQQLSGDMVSIGDVKPLLPVDNLGQVLFQLFYGDPVTGLVELVILLLRDLS